LPFGWKFPSLNAPVSQGFPEFVIKLCFLRILLLKNNWEKKERKTTEGLCGFS
jgi:hypothetical protein